MKFYDAVVGGRSVGTPGTVKLLWETHRQYGKLEWARLIEPVAKLAEQGFEVSPRLAALIAEDKERLGRFPATKAYFFDAQGEPSQPDFTEKPGLRRHTQSHRTARRLRLLSR